VPVAVAALAAASLVAGIVGTAWQAREASRERDRARAEAATAREVVDFLTGALEQANPYESLGREVTVRELMETSVERIGTELASQPAVQIRLYTTLARVVGHTGQHLRGAELAEFAAHLADSLYGPGSLESAQARYEFARNIGASDPRRMEAIVRGALRALGERKEPEALAVRADLLEELGVAYSGRVESDSALVVQREALAIRESLVEPPDVSLARSHHALGSELSRQGSAEAGTHFAVAAAQWKATLGDRHPNYAATLNNWAIWHANAGRPDSADALYREALAIDREALGPRSSVLGSRLSNVGQLALAQGRYEAADEWLREAVDILSEREEADIGLAAAFTNHGQVAFFQGEMAAAEERLLAGRAVFAELYGDPSPYTAVSDGYLARLYAATGRTEEATRLFTSSRTMFESHLPAMAGRLVSIDTWQGVMLREAGDLEAAAALLEQAVQRARENLAEGVAARLEAEAEWAALAPEGERAGSGS